MGASCKLSSSNLFLRGAGKSQVSVVKLRKDAESKVVEKEDWEVVETVGINMSCDTLDIFGHKIKGEKLKLLAANLCESRLWVNREGYCFLRLCITSVSIHFVFYQTNESFDWSQYGVSKSSVTNMTEHSDGDERLDDLRRELKDCENKLQLKGEQLKDKETEIERLRRELDRCLQEQTGHVKCKENEHKKDEEIRRLQEELKQYKKDLEIAKLLQGDSSQLLQDKEVELKARDMEVSKLREKLDQLEKDNSDELKTAQKKIAKLSAQIDKLEKDKEDELKQKAMEIANLGKRKEEEVAKLSAQLDQLQKDKEGELKKKAKEVAKLIEDFDDLGKRKEHEVAKLQKELDCSLKERADQLKIKDAKVLELQAKLDAKNVELQAELHLKEKQRQKEEENARLQAILQSPPQTLIINHPRLRPVREYRFTMQSSPQSYAPDFNNRLTLNALNDDVTNRYPEINVYVSDGRNNFDKENWSFIKVEDVNTGRQSLFALYRGTFDRTLVDGHCVNIPHHRNAICSANVRFIVASLCGHAAVYGFYYTR